MIKLICVRLKSCWDRIPDQSHRRKVPGFQFKVQVPQILIAHSHLSSKTKSYHEMYPSLSQRLFPYIIKGTLTTNTQWHLLF